MLLMNERRHLPNNGADTNFQAMTVAQGLPAAIWGCQTLKNRVLEAVAGFVEMDTMERLEKSDSAMERGQKTG